MDAGEKAAEDYANSLARRDYMGRAPDSFDPRTTFKTPAKNQVNTQLCSEFIDQDARWKWNSNNSSFIHDYNYGWGGILIIPCFLSLINFCYFRHLLWQSFIGQHPWNSPRFGWPCARQNKHPWTKVRLNICQHIYILIIFYHHPANTFLYVRAISFLSTYLWHSACLVRNVKGKVKIASIFNHNLGLMLFIAWQWLYCYRVMCPLGYKRIS